MPFISLFTELPTAVQSRLARVVESARDPGLWTDETDAALQAPLPPLTAV